MFETKSEATKAKERRDREEVRVELNSQLGEDSFDFHAPSFGLK